ncbi:hypothetical protein TNCV_4663881 [Trichonephila clavipes]|uniref:Uncharacterized protein n=1 Tax=Trichonephila clavipes TaxID=2585209 RepID=A0A8X6SLN2_TRICX|nr:hypothetical protein TNCV_4663881 [Trichonephila clavipes]
MGPPMRKREGEKWTAPVVLKGLEKPKVKKKRKKELEKDEGWWFCKVEQGGSGSFGPFKEFSRGRNSLRNEGHRGTLRSATIPDYVSAIRKNG